MKLKLNEEKFILDSQTFLEKAFGELKAKKLLNTMDPHWFIDHLCYRTVDEVNYQEMKKIFSTFGELLIESDVNGRLISTFKLHRPILFKGWTIPLVEVPAPKAGKKTIEGLEHFEVVCDVSFEEIKKRFSKCKMDEKGLSKKLNPELEVEFGDFAIKFHHQSLEVVIEIEKAAL